MKRNFSPQFPVLSKLRPEGGGSLLEFLTTLLIMSILLMLLFAHMKSFKNAARSLEKRASERLLLNRAAMIFDNAFDASRSFPALPFPELESRLQEKPAPLFVKFSPDYYLTFPFGEAHTCLQTISTSRKRAEQQPYWLLLGLNGYTFAKGQLQPSNGPLDHCSYSFSSKPFGTRRGEKELRKPLLALPVQELFRLRQNAKGIIQRQSLLFDSTQPVLHGIESFSIHPDERELIVRFTTASGTLRLLRYPKGEWSLDRYHDLILQLYLS